MTSRRGKTLAYNKETGTFRRTPTEDYAYGVAGILTASYRIGSIAAEGMATLPELDDGERGAIVFTASVAAQDRSEEHTSELQSLMRNSYAVFCLKKKKNLKKSKQQTEEINVQ